MPRVRSGFSDHTEKGACKRRNPNLARGLEETTPAAFLQGDGAAAMAALASRDLARGS